MRVSGYRLMWLMVMFDLPVLTKEDRRNYRRFVDFLEDDGYFRVQFSVYARPCATEENTQVHVNRVIDRLPPAGEIRVLKFTDKQWERMAVYREARADATETAPEQLTFFDDALQPLIDELGCDELRTKLGALAADSGSDSPEEPAPRPRRAVSPVARNKRKRRKATPQNPTLDIFD